MQSNEMKCDLMQFNVIQLYHFCDIHTWHGFPQYFTLEHPEHRLTDTSRHPGAQHNKNSSLVASINAFAFNSVKS
jgi:hypothetical protein